ncbi:MAG TPA: hypothetical protein PLZ93_04995 [Nocardioides sp.]|uniref:P-loop ATPase, Sll1717 family n=1 Tax=uncultured Nocardioides sp. TaxID=198441 RepID=UPI00260261CA|nr:hypothetical protein [uncultured Nocardioides sp.]HRD59776.1 hypothetical protein [Nocardioides sp.]HRI94944.1 hypothetical protein [Nocardioides sp.]HRK44369.1 hypothetical protein [Nocardioides sp.]
MPSEPSTDVFFAYPGSNPLRAEVMREGAKIIARRTGLRVLTWEAMQTTGSLLIGTIQQRIRDSSVVVAEVSDLNWNVLFEVGYAMAQNKHIWLLVDSTDEAATRNWKTFGLLSGLGYSDYQGDSEALASLFVAEHAGLIDRPTAWDGVTAALSVSADSRTLFYFPTSLRGDAPRNIDRALTRRKNLAVLRADEDERGYAPLAWYAELVCKSAAALVYLLGPTRTRANTHNARASLVAGLAAGLDRTVLLTAEQGFQPPIDYQDLLYTFSSAKHVVDHIDRWLDELPTSLSAGPIGLQIAMGLPERFGEYVAEYEADDLPYYFVETAEFQRVMSPGTVLFVGRKGTGKTATMLRAADELARDRRNLVTIIKPTGYEFESLLKVLRSLPEKATVDYLVDGLWQYLLYCEIACAAVHEGELRPAGIASGSSLDMLRAHLEEHGIGTDQDFSIRLERAIDELRSDASDIPDGVEDARAYLNTKLHASLLVELRRLLGDALHDRQRVAIFVDNLDKAWDRGADFERLSRVIFGLLAAVGRVSVEFTRDYSWKQRVNVSLSVFLRADIFSMVVRHAREPDKIEQLQIRWDNPQLLARVIEDRFASSQADSEVDPTTVWSQVFEEQVRGLPTREYLLWRSLPRPRDLINLCNASVMVAVNNRHAKVSEQDILEAEDQYSRFAFEALQVESEPESGLGDLLFEFVGLPATLEPAEVAQVLEKSGRSDKQEMLGTLLRSSFLGRETDEERFDFFSDEAAERRNALLAERLTARRTGRPSRFRIHPAFRPFLAIEDDDLLDRLRVQPL